MNRTDELGVLVEECRTQREILESDCEEYKFLLEALRYYDKEHDCWAGFRVSEHDCDTCGGGECLTHHVSIILFDIMVRKPELHDAAMRMSRAIHPWGPVDNDFHTSLICIGYRHEQE